MVIVGIIGIVNRILVLIEPQYGALVVSAWLVLIALNLIVSGKYLDVAVRDLVMALGSFTPARLSVLTIDFNANKTH